MFDILWLNIWLSGIMTSPVIKWCTCCLLGTSLLLLQFSYYFSKTCLLLLLFSQIRKYLSPYLTDFNRHCHICNFHSFRLTFADIPNSNNHTSTSRQSAGLTMFELLGWLWPRLPRPILTDWWWRRPLLPTSHFSLIPLISSSETWKMSLRIMLMIIMGRTQNKFLCLISSNNLLDQQEIINWKINFHTNFGRLSWIYIWLGCMLMLDRLDR